MQVRLIGIIGEGQYGRVFLGERSTGCSSTHQSEIAIKFDEDVSVDLSDEDCSLIAVKQMNKFLLLALKSQKRAIEELMGLQVCLRSQNPWIVQLAFAFQDSNNVYIATEYLCGGNLRSYIQSGLSKEEIRFIFTELVLAIHSLHSLGFMHRDL